MHHLPAFLGSYMRARKLGRNFQSRAEFDVWQSKQITRWLDRSASRAPAFATYSPEGGLAALPRIDKSDLMAQFERYNIAGITREAGFKAFEGSGRHGKWFVGASTGTSGNRGLYVLSDRERFMWLGAMLGKVLPDFLSARRKVAVVLPLNSSLYDSARPGTGGRLDLRFFDLMRGPAAWSEEIFTFKPDIIIAPPRVLRWIAEWNNRRLRPERLISGAEVLDPEDRSFISANLGPVEEIYMATEGLLATSCQHGRLHLAEDFVHFDLEPFGDLVSPVITDFTRRSQIMARYRMNDLLRISQAPCPCGSVFRVVEDIVGRQDDIFLFPASDGLIEVTPDVMRNTIVDASRQVEDYRLHQVGPEEVTLHLTPGVPSGVQVKVKKAIESRLSHLGVTASVTLCVSALRFDPSQKLRRIRREWQP